MFQVPSSSLGGGLSSRCQFGATPDGAYICVVNSVSMHNTKHTHMYNERHATFTTADTLARQSGTCRASAKKICIRHVVSFAVMLHVSHM